ncbi:hypothetical protein OG981_53760 [Streptomyces mirabilis]|uniref:hypothetical protein n=1 Tax=Streptomyces mirabilis TaxID=68239 RepID=UPI002E237CF9
MTDSPRTVLSGPIPASVSASFPGVRQVTMRVAFGTRDELDGFKPFFKEQQAWAREQIAVSLTGMTSREAAARRGRWDDEKAELRRRGQLIDSLDSLVTAGLCRALEKRGWNREWDLIPRQAKTRGRTCGSPGSGWPEQISVRLPADLVHTVYAACWHTSKEARDALEKWQTRYPKARPNLPLRTRCDADALAEYRELCAKINHRGDVWRDAVASGIGIARTTLDPATGTG